MAIWEQSLSSSRRAYEAFVLVQPVVEGCNGRQGESDCNPTRLTDGRPLPMRLARGGLLAVTPACDVHEAARAPMKACC